MERNRKPHPKYGYDYARLKLSFMTSSTDSMGSFEVADALAL